MISKETANKRPKSVWTISLFFSLSFSLLPTPFPASFFLLLVVVLLFKIRINRWALDMVIVVDGRVSAACNVDGRQKPTRATNIES